MGNEQLTSDAGGLAFQSAPDLVRDVLFVRSANAALLRNETAAVRELSGIVEDEQGALLRFLSICRDVCGAESAGVSRIENVGELPFIRWRAISGPLSVHEGATLPRNFSACGLSLDRRSSLIMERPQRAFGYLGELEPHIAELLIVPLFAGDAPIGTLWLAHHESAAHFCCDDARVIERLALHLSWAFDLSNRTNEHRRALAERDRLLRDAHHRVGNTLQIAMSALSVQSNSNHALPADALRTAYARLQAMAQVHVMLAQSLGDIVMLAPLLQTIVDGVSACYLGPSSPVRIRLEMDPIALQGDRAIAIGLLVNEALTNACKHAFPGGRSGEILVAARIERANTLIVQIADDGVGGAHGRTGGFGLSLVRGFAEQVQGALSIEPSAGGVGTTITLICEHDPSRQVNDHPILTAQSDPGTSWN